MNVKVPTMTSDTTPSGEVKACDYYNDINHGGVFYPYYAFDDNQDTMWLPLYRTVSTKWIQYEFKNPICVKKIYLSIAIEGNKFKYIIKGSYDEVTWFPLTDINGSNFYETEMYIDIYNNNGYYKFYRLETVPIDTTEFVRIKTLQLYGRLQN